MEIKKIHDLPAGPAIQDEFELPASIGTGPTDVKRFTFAALKVWILAFVGPYISGITIGPTGPTGATGATGPAGVAGATGPSGVTLLTVASQSTMQNCNRTGSVAAWSYTCDVMTPSCPTGTALTGAQLWLRASVQACLTQLELRRRWPRPGSRPAVPRCRPCCAGGIACSCGRTRGPVSRSSAWSSCSCRDSRRGA